MGRDLVETQDCTRDQINQEILRYMYETTREELEQCRREHVLQMMAMGGSF